MPAGSPVWFSNYDEVALEWCENRLLNHHLPDRTTDLRAAPETFEAFADLTTGELAVITKLLRRKTFKAGETIISAGDAATEIFLLVSGCVSVTVTMASGVPRRLGTFSPGMAFGEMAVIDRAPRSAKIVADTAVECDLLTLEDFDRLAEKHHHVMIKLLRNLCRSLSGRLRKANRELSVFD